MDRHIVELLYDRFEEIRNKYIGLEISGTSLSELSSEINMLAEDFESHFDETPKFQVKLHKEIARMAGIYPLNEAGFQMARKIIRLSKKRA